MVGTKRYDDISAVINNVADEVNSTLEECRKQRYFETVVLLYSFIENLLKWLVFVEILWMKATRRDFRPKDFNLLRNYAKNLNFYGAQHLAFSLKVIDGPLFDSVDAIRK
jgi:hypothetical protein